MKSTLKARCQCIFFYATLALFAVFSTQVLWGAPQDELSDLPVIMPGEINVVPNDTIVTSQKVEAGLLLAIGASNHFRYIPTTLRDSLLNAAGEPSTMAEAATQLEASAIGFVTVQRFVNLVRAEVTLAEGNNFEDRRTGVGMAAIRYAADNDDPVADPAILAAIQRAFIGITGDPDLYRDLDTGLRVVPARVIAPGGISFPPTTADKPQWDLFKAPTVVSFDIVQTIVHALQDREDLIVVDVETRDSMYATGGLYLVENDRQAANSELRILKLFGVDAMISGSFSPQGTSAELELHEMLIKPDGSFASGDGVTAAVAEDKTEDLRGAVVECLEGLYPTSPQDSED